MSTVPAVLTIRLSHLRETLTTIFSTYSKPLWMFRAFRAFKAFSVLLKIGFEQTLQEDNLIFLRK